MSRVSSFVLAITAMVSFTVNASAQSKSREQILEDIAAKRAELSELEKQFLAPAEEDQAAFAGLLAQPNTGVIRLLPRDVYESESYKKNKKTIVITGGGAYYSFSRLTHEYGYGSDIELSSGYLSVGFAGADYGMLLKLGDVPLEELSTALPGVFTLAKYKPATSEPDARVEQRRFGMGTTIDEFSFKERVPVEVNATYILRSIDYGTSDVLVGIRVAREDTDGSLIIAWKLLKKYPVPQLARNN